MRNVIHINLIVTMFISKLAFVTVHYLQDIPVSIITQQELKHKLELKQIICTRPINKGFRNTMSILMRENSDPSITLPVVHLSRS